MKRPPLPSHNGFTLLELLISLGLVAILATVLIAIVRSASHSVDQTKNINQLRQIGMACLQYANDHNRLFPIYGSPGRRQNTCSHGLDSDSAPVKLFTKSALTLGRGTQDYITNPDIFYSPHARVMARERKPGLFNLRPGKGYLIGYIAISLPKTNDLFPERDLLTPGIHNERLEDGVRAPLYCDFPGVLAEEEGLDYEYCTFVLTDGSVGQLPQRELFVSWARIIKKMAGQ